MGHGHDISSIRMLKQCGEAFCGLRNIIFKTCLSTDKFHSECKKGNVAPIYKKDDKRTVKYYHPASPLPIFSKMLKRLTYSVTQDFFSDNFHCPNQSGFRSSYYCINQLLSINHEILNAFDIGLKLCRIFLDILKVFNKVWHNGLIFKLRQKGIS